MFSNSNFFLSKSVTFTISALSGLNVSLRGSRKIWLSVTSYCCSELGVITVLIALTFCVTLKFVFFSAAAISHSKVMHIYGMTFLSTTSAFAQLAQGGGQPQGV